MMEKFFFLFICLIYIFNIIIKNYKKYFITSFSKNTHFFSVFFFFNSIQFHSIPFYANHTNHRLLQRKTSKNYLCSNPLDWTLIRSPSGCFRKQLSRKTFLYFLHYLVHDETRTHLGTHYASLFYSYSS